jgi:tRNA(Arg) A34 adenosine deaminase TadA
MIEVLIGYPEWVDAIVDWTRFYRSDREKLELAIQLAQANVDHQSGGPFGAAVFAEASGRLLSVGMNSVTRLGNSNLHAEVLALMMAQERFGSHNLAAGGEVHVLASSCEPCAMCLGATLWSRVSRLLWGARRTDAQELRFEIGPMFADADATCASSGVELVRDLMRAEARQVLERYQRFRGLLP